MDIKQKHHKQPIRSSHEINIQYTELCQFLGQAEFQVDDLQRSIRVLKARIRALSSEMKEAVAKEKADLDNKVILDAALKVE
jgi:uncharacterized coiled-coil protein SlyX